MGKKVLCQGYIPTGSVKLQAWGQGSSFESSNGKTMQLQKSYNTIKNNFNKCVRAGYPLYLFCQTKSPLFTRGMRIDNLTNKSNINFNITGGGTEILPL